MWFGSTVDDRVSHNSFTWYYTGHSIAELGRLDLIQSPGCMFPTVSDARHFIEGALDAAASINCHCIADYIIAHFMGRLCIATIRSASYVAKERKYTDMCAKLETIKTTLENSDVIRNSWNTDPVLYCLVPFRCYHNLIAKFWRYERTASDDLVFGLMGCAYNRLAEAGLDTDNYSGIWTPSELEYLPVWARKDTALLCHAADSK